MSAPILKAPIFKKVAILGVGLMGGSLAAGLKKVGAVECITGWGRNPDNLKVAKEKHIIDSWSLKLDEVLDGCDCVVVATPSQFSEQLLIDVVKACGSSVAITDVASVKGNLVRVLENEFGNLPNNVVLGHPIVGSEKSGVNACDDSLYVGHNVILVDVDGTQPALLSAVFDMWELVGAKVSTMKAEQHDAVLALTSHLPHMLSYTLVSQIADNPEEGNIFEYAAGGFKDFTRIAGSDPVMWAEICLANAEKITESIDVYAAHLDKVKTAILNNDRETLLSLFENAKQHRDKFSRVYQARLDKQTIR